MEKFRDFHIPENIFINGKSYLYLSIGTNLKSDNSSFIHEYLYFTTLGERYEFCFTIIQEKDFKHNARIPVFILL